MTVDAPLESVWEVIADVTRTSEWSHECHHVGWLGGATGGARRAVPRAQPGGLAALGPDLEVLAVDPPRQIAWRTIPTALMVDSSDWRISLAPAGAGTQIVQTFAVTKCPRWWEWILARSTPGTSIAVPR